MAMAVMAGLLALGGVAQAWEFGALSAPEAATKGATHYARFQASDFTVAGSNAIQAFTSSVPAKTAVSFVYMDLDTAFDTANTAHVGSVAATIGDGTDVDLFLTSTELASDGTEVFIKYGSANSNTVSVTLQTAIITNVGAGLAPTNLYNVVTNLQVASTQSALGSKLYTTAGGIVFTFTPNSEESISSNAVGDVTFYFKKLPQ
jgi:hypothetical protein